MKRSKTKEPKTKCQWLTNHLKNLVAKRNMLQKTWSKKKAPRSKITLRNCGESITDELAIANAFNICFFSIAKII